MSDNDKWPTGENSPWPRPDDGVTGTGANDNLPVPNEILGTFANFIETRDEVYRGGDGHHRTVMWLTLLRQDGEQVELRLPTELVLGLADKCIEHLAFIFPYRAYDAPVVTDQALEEEFPNG